MNPSSKPLLVKVCGMRESANIEAVADLRPDFLGFIFHPGSSRYAGTALQPELLRALPESVRKIGVFVDASTSHILATLAAFGLDGVQLHGQETPAQCAELCRAGVLVIKTFSVGASLDLGALRPYEGTCDYFLFDTKGLAPGGNGIAFDWNLLHDYNLSTPYLLAGGIGPENIAALTALHLPGLAGVDLNSRFETAPGYKDAARLAPALALLRRGAAPRAQAA
jgi:phosphoribosylanthranilate isomerase